MNAATQITITARRYEKCPAGACLVVTVPADPSDLFPGLFSDEAVVECAACRDRELARREAQDTAAMLAERDEEGGTTWACRDDDEGSTWAPSGGL